MTFTAEKKPRLRLLLAIYTRELKTAFFLALSNQPLMQVVASATNTPELLSYTRVFQPDAIILEWELPGRPMAEVIPTLAQADNAAGLFIISKPSSDQQIGELASTADRFDQPDDLINALEALRARKH